jgi:hypothetical protein
VEAAVGVAVVADVVRAEQGVEGAGGGGDVDEVEVSGVVVVLEERGVEDVEVVVVGGFGRSWRRC